MRRLLPRIVLAAALLAIGYWAWIRFFPPPEQRIRKTLSAVAQTASYSSKESQFARAWNAQKLAAFFTPGTEIRVDVPGQSVRTISGRDDLYQVILMARSLVASLKLEFVGLNIQVAPDKASASVDLTAKATVPSEKDWVPQEFNLTLLQTNGQWLIDRVETVRPLR
jgi:hypothetical protein